MNQQGQRWLWWFGLSVMFPSTALFQRHVGWVGVVVYLLCGSLLLWLLVRRVWPLIYRWMPACYAPALLTLTILLLLATFIRVYPTVNTALPGQGSDGDDALNLAAHELLQGRYPYYGRTYLDNPVVNLPGAILLALPFTVLGQTAAQNFFWLALFCMALRRHWQDSRTVLFYFWSLLLASPYLIYALWIGNDHISNSLQILLFSWGLMESAGKNSKWAVIWAILLGIGLSSRLNFILLLPLFFAALWRRVGKVPAFRYTTLTVFTFTALTLPFYLYDPTHFTPALTANKLAQFDPYFPNASLIISLSTALFALLVAFHPQNGHWETMCRHAALILALPIFSSIALFSIAIGQPNLRFAHYTLFILFFATTATWQPTQLPPSQPIAPH